MPLNFIFVWPSAPEPQPQAGQTFIEKDRSSAILVLIIIFLYMVPGLCRQSHLEGPWEQYIVF
jgi:hypothetical protein